MHELSIATLVLDAVNAEANLRPAMRVSRIGVRLGDLAGVDADALTFCFEALIKNTALASAALEIERRPQRNRCSRCNREFVVVNYESACPACGESSTQFVSGDELELAFVEMEEP
ncbi:MAG TPA: hydrogenase maturation nickel metallochaperone HypA [Methylomirabilota bacterium]|jgi:hydrogenase nickel incorporation protein HypA/HybF|nr:hydrogenase maturation nickel metallochaperone HypA [Methylomirabilota bacterium]